MTTENTEVAIYINEYKNVMRQTTLYHMLYIMQAIIGT